MHTFHRTELSTATSLAGHIAGTARRGASRAATPGSTKLRGHDQLRRNRPFRARTPPITSTRALGIIPGSISGAGLMAQAGALMAARTRAKPNILRAIRAVLKTLLTIPLPILQTPNIPNSTDSFEQPDRQTLADSGSLLFAFCPTSQQPGLTSQPRTDSFHTFVKGQSFTVLGHLTGILLSCWNVFAQSNRHCTIRFKVGLCGQSPSHFCNL